MSRNDEVLAALKTVMDPDLNKDIVSLGFIKDLKLIPNSKNSKQDDLTFTIELTTPACPLKEQIKSQALDALARIEGLESIQITLSSRVREGAGLHPNYANQQRIKGVKKIIAVGSGKGGVGKSTLALSIALAFQKLGARVGLLDADVYGPSQAILLGLQIHSPTVKNSKIVPVQAFGLEVISFAFFSPPGEAVVWRGAMIGKAVQQMLFDVEWGELDYLVVDLPPGTGDIPITLIHSVPVSGAVLVSMPQLVSVADTVRGAGMFKKMDVPILGFVENMAIKKSENVILAAAECKTTFLGSIPRIDFVGDAGDAGIPLFISHPENEFSKTVMEITKKIAQQLSILEERV